VLRADGALGVLGAQGVTDARQGASIAPRISPFQILRMESNSDTTCLKPPSLLHQPESIGSEFLHFLREYRNNARTE
jgi:hypothetical protein